ncbi:MAG: hypothetical protein J5993_02690 [Clostridia bacterium]|nr:hypothetical protein [Clostridia bacterium]
MKGNTQNKAVYLRCKQALLSLVKKMPFDSVGIKDVVSECGFSRQYFYRFYASKFDLVYDIFEEGFLAAVNIFTFNRSIPQLLREIEKNAFLYRKIMESSYAFDLYRLFLTAGKASAIVLAEAAFIRKFTSEQEATIDFLFHGMASVLFERLMTGKPLEKANLTLNIAEGLSRDIDFLFKEEATAEQIVYKLRRLYFEKRRVIDAN